MPGGKIITVYTGATGLEPAISGLTGQHDKPASLRPQLPCQIIRIMQKCQVFSSLFPAFAIPANPGGAYIGKIRYYAAAIPHMRL